jgi:Ino eighty subunit 2
MDTINRLLKKQAPKARGRRAVGESQSNVDGSGVATPSEQEPNAPRDVRVRWISNKSGNRIGVPGEWLAAPVGAIFRGSVAYSASNKMVQEVIEDKMEVDPVA